MIRDIAERGRDYAGVLRRYNKFVKKDFEDYVKPFMKYADIIVPGGANNDSKDYQFDFFLVGLQFIYENLLSNLKKLKRRNSLVDGIDEKSNLLDLVMSKNSIENSSHSNLFYSYNPHSHSFFLLKGLKQDYDIQFFK